MPPQLTKKSKVSKEAKRISRLTNPHEQHFKIIFSHQIEPGFMFRSMYRRQGSNLSNEEKLKIFRSLGCFLDDCVQMSITEVEHKYERPPDSSDGTYDPETQEEVQIQHLCLFPLGTPPNLPSDSIRFHGYFRPTGGYFIITRLDWFHDVH